MADSEDSHKVKQHLQLWNKALILLLETINNFSQNFWQKPNEKVYFKLAKIISLIK